MKTDDQQAKRVFHLSNPADLFKKLDWEIDCLREVIESQPNQSRLNHELAAYHAFNTAVTAWHMTDWVWTTLTSDDRSKLASDLGFKLSDNQNKNFTSFKNAVVAKSGALRICKEVANGSKHLENRKNSKVDAQVSWKSKVATAGELRAGQPLQTFTYEFVVTVDNKIFSILDVFEEVKEFWLQFLFQQKFLKDFYVNIEFDIKKTTNRN